MGVQQLKRLCRACCRQQAHNLSPDDAIDSV
jgi:hypothetical protein